MDLILLPGVDPANKEWIEALQEKCKNDFTEADVLYYTHWAVVDDSGELSDKHIDIPLEAKRLSELAEGRKGYRVFAKSAGVFVCLYAIKEFGLSPQRCIFVGTPESIVEKGKTDVQLLFSDIKIPITFIQNKEDPVLSFEDLKQMIENYEISNKKFVAMEGNSHDYSDLDTLRTEIIS